MSKVYISTPIYYVNGAPHIGHAHTTVMADILKRSRLMMGMDAWLTTGTDEHGQKNQEAAEKSGQECQDYLDQKSGEFRTVFDRLGVSYDMFVRTTRPEHMKQVAHIEQTLFDQGLIVKKKYSGQYCTGCEQFKKESDLTPEGRCPDHSNVELEQTDEVNYFLQIEPYREWLRDYAEQNPEWLQPSRYRSELLGMLKEPLEDLCISRPKTRVSLGVELPFDSDYVTYVWFDALINYITNVGWPDEKYNDWWPYSMHLIGKDIVKTHCIYWPIMLHALDVAPPNQVVVHGYWVGPGGQKMSKTLGNVVDPIEVMDTFGADALRFYLAKHMRGSVDSQISMELMLQTYTSDLANNIGNLLARVSKFANSRFDGVIPAPENIHPDDQKLAEAVAANIGKACGRYEMTDIPDVLNAILAEARALNEYVADKAPWTMIKDEDARDRVASILYVALDGLRLVFEGLYPFVPETANKGLAVLGRENMNQKVHQHVFQAGDLKPASAFGDMVNLFPRIDLK